MLAGVREAAGASIDAVVACAGVSGRADRLDESVRVNYFGVVVGLEGLQPLLAAGSDPRAVVVSSIRDHAVPPEYRTLVHTCLAGDEDGACAMAHGFSTARLVYAASKQAVSRWVRRAAPSPAWAGAGIALNAVGPSVIDTPMAGRMLSAENRATAAAENPMPFLGIPAPAESVAHLLAWLASAENRIVTGQVIYADGGSDALIRGDDVF
jgi:NAD(P)-dependent dehydrogenase (short-subunit alcohol dehydrogenase family)